MAVDLWSAAIDVFRSGNMVLASKCRTIRMNADMSSSQFSEVTTVLSLVRIPRAVAC